MPGAASCRVRLVLPALLLALVPGGCSTGYSDDGPTGDDAREARVDERAGVLGGIRFGATEQRVRDRLGEPTDQEDGFFPAGADYTGPPAIPSPRADQGTRAPPTPLHYGETAYLVSPTVGVFSMATLADGARTARGVAVGDPLERVRARYTGVRCGEAVAGEPLFGAETPKYGWCRAIVDGVRVFFGGDPIESITLTHYANETQ